MTCQDKNSLEEQRMYCRTPSVKVKWLKERSKKIGHLIKNCKGKIKYLKMAEYFNQKCKYQRAEHCPQLRQKEKFLEKQGGNCKMTIDWRLRTSTILAQSKHGCQSFPQGEFHDRR